MRFEDGFMISLDCSLCMKTVKLILLNGTIS